MPLNFGPLSQEGGERRLNVAITRARRQVVLYTSFEPTQLRIDETKSIGLKHLRSYMEMADVGAKAIESALLRRRDRDLHREDIAEALRDRGYVVQTDVGLSDFRVDLTVAAPDEPARPLAAVLLDGLEWSGRATIGDRDTLPVEVLGRMLKWPHVARIWLPAWLTDRTAVLDGFEESLTRALTAHPTDTEPQETQLVDERRPEPNAPAVDSFEHADSAAAESYPAVARQAADEADPWAALLGSSLQASLAGPSAVDAGDSREPFRPWIPGYLGGREVLDSLDRSRSARQQVQRAIQDAIAAEGPIHRDRLAKLVAAAFDLSRVSTKRAESILGIVPRVHYKGDEPDVFWDVAVDPKDWDRYRFHSEVTRPMEHVPLRELANAMRSICRVSGGAERPELLREALAAFGFKRLTQGIEARLEQGLDHALEAGLLERRAGVYVAA